MANRVASLMVEVGANVARMQRDMGQITSTVKQSVNQWSGVLKSAKGAFAAYFSVQAVESFAKAIYESGVRVQSLSRAFKSIAGADAGKEMQFVRDTAKQLGLNFYDLIDGYKGMAAAAKGTSLEGAGVQTVFRGMSDAAVGLSLSGDQVQGAFLALGQMMSKGKVAAEELRLQLAERIPGAIPMFADAIGVTTKQLDKMLERGEVTLEMLRKFGELLSRRFGVQALKAATEDSARAMDRLSEAWTDLKANLANSDYIYTYVKGLSTLISWLNEGSDVWSNFNKLASLNAQGRLSFVEWMQMNSDEARKYVENVESIESLSEQIEQLHFTRRSKLYASERAVIDKTIASLTRLLQARRLAAHDASWVKSLEQRDKRVASASGDIDLYISDLPEVKGEAELTKYKKAMEALDQLRKDNAISEEEYAQKSARIQATYAFKTKALATSEIDSLNKLRDARMDLAVIQAEQSGDSKATKLLQAQSQRDAAIAGLQKDIAKSKNASDRVALREAISYEQQKYEARKRFIEQSVPLEDELTAATIRRQIAEARGESTLAADLDVIEAQRKVSRLHPRSPEAAGADSLATAQRMQLEREELQKIIGARSELAQLEHRSRDYNLAQIELLQIEQQLATTEAERAVIAKKMGTAQAKADGDGWAAAKDAVQEYGATVSDTYANIQDYTQSSLDYMQDGLKQFFLTGKAGWEDFGDFAANILADIAAKRVMAFATSAIDSGLSWLGTSLFSANGNVLSGPGISALSGGVYDRPTYFGFDRHLTAFASGGVLGEAGAEAVMPLARTSSGKLGVMAEGGGGNKTQTLVIRIKDSQGKQAAAPQSFDLSGFGQTVLDIVYDGMSRNEGGRWR